MTKCLKSLVDMYARLIKMKISIRPTELWFDDSCHAVKPNTGRLERQYRQYHIPSTHAARKRQSRFLRSYLQERYKEYWMSTINAKAVMVEGKQSAPGSAEIHLMLTHFRRLH